HAEGRDLISRPDASPPFQLWNIPPQRTFASVVAKILEERDMRKHLMLSTAAVGLILASGFAYAQAPAERRDEPKRTEEPAKGAAQQHGQGSAQERSQERAQGAQERMQGAGREEKGGANHQANEEKNRPAAAAESNQPKAKEQ